MTASFQHRKASASGFKSIMIIHCVIEVALQQSNDSKGPGIV